MDTDGTFTKLASSETGEMAKHFCLTRHGKIKPQRNVADEHHHLAPHCLITVTAASICNLHAVAVVLCSVIFPGPERRQSP